MRPLGPTAQAMVRTTSSGLATVFEQNRACAMSERPTHCLAQFHLDNETRTSSVPQEVWISGRRMRACFSTVRRRSGPATRSFEGGVRQQSRQPGQKQPQPDRSDRNGQSDPRASCNLPSVQPQCATIAVRRTKGTELCGALRTRTRRGVLKSRPIGPSRCKTQL
jgi:hypothetical protein